MGRGGSRRRRRRSSRQRIKREGRGGLEREIPCRSRPRRRPAGRTCPRFPWHGRRLSPRSGSLAIARRAAGFPFGAAVCPVFATYGK
jgi:hypothetical protein